MSVRKIPQMKTWHARLDVGKIWTIEFLGVDPDGGYIMGQGSDKMGPFSIMGTIDSNNYCEFKKEYCTSGKYMSFVGDLNEEGTQIEGMCGHGDETEDNQFKIYDP